MSTSVLGADGCKGGWCAVAMDATADGARASGPTVYRSFREVLDTNADVICVDIPIGLLDGPGRRRCDTETRELLGQRRATVFDPPCREAISQTDFHAANAANRAATGRGLSIQAHGIAPKIAEVDAVMTPDLQSRVLEVHPELCFRALNGGQPVLSSKKRVAGRDERWRLLRAALASLPEEPPRPRDLPTGCAPDDYVDALAVAWTAVCVARGRACRIPDEPEVDPRGLRMEMWYPCI